MSNIYIRLPRYVAAYFRSLGDGESLPHETPIHLSPLTDEYVLLTSGLLIVPPDQQRRSSCYSQTAWNNMLCGRKPDGGDPLLHRNRKQHLSYAEVCTLDGLRNFTKADAFDFLAIALPTSIVQNGRTVKVCGNHTLARDQAQQLRQLLRTRMMRAFLRWDNDNTLFAATQNITRTQVEVLERFLMEHNVPVSHDQVEMESLRRLAIRWREEAHRLTHSKRIRGNKTITRIGKEEIRQIKS